RAGTPVAPVTPSIKIRDWRESRRLAAGTLNSWSGLPALRNITLNPTGELSRLRSQKRISFVSDPRMISMGGSPIQRKTGLGTKRIQPLLNSNLASQLFGGNANRRKARMGNPQMS